MPGSGTKLRVRMPNDGMSPARFVRIAVPYALVQLTLATVYVLLFVG